MSRTSRTLPLLAILTLIANLAAQSRAETLDTAEERLRTIYDRGTFRAKTWRGSWLPDSSGYVIRGQDPKSRRPVMLKVAVDGLKRTPLTPAEQQSLNRSDRRAPTGDREWSLRRGRLFARVLATDSITQLTEKAAPGTRIGRVSWSPDGQRLAFVETNVSKVRQRSSLVPSDPSYPRVREVRFARVGSPIPSLRVGIVEAQGGEPRWVALKPAKEGFYLGQVAWAGNSEELLIERLSRFRDEREFLLANARTGSIQRIYRETSPAWVVASYGVNLGLEWIRDGKAFVVFTERDGWRHTYLYDRDGTPKGLITPGAFDIIERAAIDHAGGWLYFYASPDNATQKYLFRASLTDLGKVQRITPESQPGTHHYRFSPDARWAFHTYSRADTPPITELVQLAGHRVVQTLEDNATLRQRATAAGHRATEFLQIETSKGVELDAWLMKPPGFDPKRKYPVLVYVYSEPHAQTVLDAWGTVHADYHRLVSDLGYLVLSIDSRGTPAPKGAAWRRAVFGSLGPLSTEEQARALKTLAATRTYLDLSRVGIWGWSGGGSNTLNAMFRKPELYRVGIAVAAKPQPHLYNAWFQEIYMRTREVNADGYRRSAPIHFAEGLRGDLLIVHGTGEDNTHIQITEGLVDRLIELGKRFDYFTYPNRRHGIRKGRGTAVHLRMLMIRYLLDHLPAGPR